MENPFRDFSGEPARTVLGDMVRPQGGAGGAPIPVVQTALGLGRYSRRVKLRSIPQPELKRLGDANFEMVAVARKLADLMPKTSDQHLRGELQAQINRLLILPLRLMAACVLRSTSTMPVKVARSSRLKFRRWLN